MQYVNIRIFLKICGMILYGLKYKIVLYVTYIENMMELIIILIFMITVYNLLSLEL